MLDVIIEKVAKSDRHMRGGDRPVEGEEEAAARSVIPTFQLGLGCVSCLTPLPGCHLSYAHSSSVRCCTACSMWATCVGKMSSDRRVTDIFGSSISWPLARIMFTYFFFGSCFTSPRRRRLVGVVFNESPFLICTVSSQASS